MKRLESGLKQSVALCVVAFLIAPTLALAAPAASVSIAGFAPIPSNASTQASTAGVSSGINGPAGGGTQTSSATTPAATSQTASPQTPSSVPSGTAAAPYEKQDGITASQPAGAAIAPAKQRRIRTFAIRAALLVGAAIAIGVVVGASEGSSSKP